MKRKLISIRVYGAVVAVLFAVAAAAEAAGGASCLVS